MLFKHSRKSRTGLESMEEKKRLKSITPYKELSQGEERIYDHLKKGFKVPDKVIAYLKTTKPYLMSPGVYEHPFKEGMRLLGPYLYTDDVFYWDRDTWKYVVKYGLELPDEFIDHVMSEEGTAFLEEQLRSDKSWSSVISDWKEKKDVVWLIPDSAGDRALEEF